MENSDADAEARASVSADISKLDANVAPLVKTSRRFIACPCNCPSSGRSGGGGDGVTGDGA